MIFGAQAPVDEVGDAGLVFDQQNVHAVASVCFGRQRDRHRGSFTQTACHFNPSFMCLDDGLGDGQPEAQALGVVRRGIAGAAEALEDALELLGRNADAVIGDAHS